MQAAVNVVGPQGFSMAAGRKKKPSLLRKDYHPIRTHCYVTIILDGGRDTMLKSTLGISE